jgi:hypothetical protein
MCLEVVGCLEALAKDAVVVDFAIDGKRDGLILADQGLCARVNTNDTQTLVDEDWAWSAKKIPIGDVIGGILVSLAIQLPLQSGPLWRTALPILRAVGLNF